MHHESRVASDQALLFLSSFAAFLFATIMTFVIRPSLQDAVIILPFLFMSVALPLYAGYMRGAIENPNALTDRSRGWVYLIFGSSYYSLVLVQLDFGYGPRSIISLLEVGVFLVATFALILFTRSFVMWFYKVNADGTVPMRDKISIVTTVFATFISALFFQAVAGAALGVPINNAPFVYNQVQNEEVWIMFGLIFVIPVLVSEFFSHHFLDEAVDVFLSEKKKGAIVPRSKNPSKLTLLIADSIIIILSTGKVAPKTITKFVYLGCLGAAIAVIGSGVMESIDWVGLLMMILGDSVLYYALYKGMGTSLKRG